MCSTPKRTGTMFRAARVEESRTDSADYANMLRRASSRMDSLERERDARRASRQPPRDDPGSRRKPLQTPPASALLSRVWHYLNTPHYLFR